MAGPSWQPRCTRETLRRRAELVDRVRAFFRARNVLEVDTPVLQGGANLDHGVVPFRLDTPQGPRFLPTSPEHPLKRLVAAGCGAVWTLAPAFRLGERGKRHAPEFRMLEWYQPGWDDLRLRDEVVELLDDLTGLGRAVEVLPWREAFRRHARLDPVTADDRQIGLALGAAADAVMSGDRLDRPAALDLLLTEQVEPHLGQNVWTIMSDYPASACAQARLRPDADGNMVAARFEIYRNGVELANGYEELTDAFELEQRLRKELGQRTHGEALDQRFLEAMAAGLPACAGVAVGFDRVAMLALGAKDITQIQAFCWENA